MVQHDCILTTESTDWIKFQGDQEDGMWELTHTAAEVRDTTSNLNDSLSDTYITLLKSILKEWRYQFSHAQHHEKGSHVAMGTLRHVTTPLSLFRLWLEEAVTCQWVYWENVPKQLTHEEWKQWHWSQLNTFREKLFRDLLRFLFYLNRGNNLFFFKDIIIWYK